MSDIGDWFRSIPAITRYWFAATVAVPLVGKLGLISPAYFFLWPEAFLYRFQIWRPITATFYFPVGPGTGFLYLVNLYFLYQYSTRLETGLLMIPLIMSVLYVWAQLNRDMIKSLFIQEVHFLTRPEEVTAEQHTIGKPPSPAQSPGLLFTLGDPWIQLYHRRLEVINELIGNLVGHLYFFLMFRYPMDLGGRNFLSTPQFLYRWLPSRRGGVSGFGVPPASMRRAADQNGGGGRHNWGQGFRLGDQ
ncbi:derlin-3 isoform X2 [Prionailurus iriomotensis]